MTEVRQLLGADGLPKFFFTQEKADKFIANKKAGATHGVKDIGGKFTILPLGEIDATSSAT